MLANEAGLFGAAGLLGAYLLLVFRGFKTALLAGDGFSKLLATGLTAVLALQVFVIVGGVTRVIPLTGVTLPVRLLRRQLDRGQHGAAGIALDRVRQGASRARAARRPGLT